MLRCVLLRLCLLLAMLAMTVRGQDRLENMAHALLQDDLQFDLQRLRANEPPRPEPLRLPVLPDDTLLGMRELVSPSQRQAASAAARPVAAAAPPSRLPQAVPQPHAYIQQQARASVALPGDGNSAQRTLDRMRQESRNTAIQMARTLLQGDQLASAAVDPALATGAELPDPSEFSPADQLPEPAAAARFSPQISNFPSGDESGAPWAGSAEAADLGMVVPMLPSDGSLDSEILPGQAFLPVDNLDDGEYSSQNEPDTATDGLERIADKLNRVGLAMMSQYKNSRKEKEWVAQVSQTMEVYRQKADEVAASFERRKTVMRQLLAQKRRLEAAQKQIELQTMLDAQRDKLKATSDELRVVQDQMNQFTVTKTDIQTTISGLQKQLEKLGVSPGTPDGQQQQQQQQPQSQEVTEDQQEKQAAVDLQEQEMRGASLMQKQLSGSRSSPSSAARRSLRRPGGRTMVSEAKQRRSN